MSRDIIIHYDENRGVLVFSTVDHVMTEPLLSKALPLETSIDSLKNMSPDEAEQKIGAGVFALIDIHGRSKIGIRDYGSITREWSEKIIDKSRMGVGAGGSLTLFEQAMELISEGLSEKSREKMERAEKMLQRAADDGCVEAVEYFLNLWPALKNRADRGFG